MGGEEKGSNGFKGVALGMVWPALEGSSRAFPGGAWLVVQAEKPSRKQN